VPPIRIAAQLHPQHGTYPGFRDAAVRAEELSYDIVYTWDHFFPLYGARDDLSLECWTTLAGIAEATSRIEIGPLVACNAYRNPELLAYTAGTVDGISGGRLILGIGSGWFRRDFDAFGYPFGSHGERLRQLGADLPRILARLEQLEPPLSRRMPLLIAGTGERRTLRLVAEFADGWHAGFPDRPADLQPKVDALLRWCDEQKRDASAIEWGVGVEPEDLDRFLDRDAETYVEMGFRQFTLGFNGPAWNVEAGARWLVWRDAHNKAPSGIAAGAQS
jgi:probable F420-dependent oxidoreductase